MIRKLRLKFIILAMTALISLLTVIVVGMNIINYNSIVTEADTILDILTQNKGKFPEFGNNKFDRIPPNFSMETAHEIRYFSVFLDDDNNILNFETGKIASIDEQTARFFAKEVLKEKEKYGFINDFRYIINEDTKGARIIFLDCRRKLDSFYTFLFSSIFMTVTGLIIVFIIIFIFAGKIIRPIAESYEKQKRFITDAGHEMKTPLTIINANIDILEMEIGENESLTDIQLQTQRLCSLTNDLVTLVRMEETEDSLSKIDFPISEVASETVNSFCAVALNEEKELVFNIQPFLSLNGNDKSIRQLISIFLDNALKYSPKGGKINFELQKNNRNIVITVCNSTNVSIKEEQLSFIFERFYRTDESRNSMTGGYGIGLSIAKAIVNAHSGKINAWINKKNEFCICACFPI